MTVNNNTSATYFSTTLGNLYHGDCLNIMKEIPDDTIDSIITDPPYALNFMGKGWDKVLPTIEIWKECLRIAKPGAIILAFGGTRTYHRLCCDIEDAGWKIKDCIMWIYGSGFPKGTDISKAIDKLSGTNRKIIGKGKGRTGKAAQPNGSSFSDDSYQWPGVYNITEPSTDEAKQFSGYSTCLKPAYEPIIMAIKPSDGTYAENAIEHSVAGMNIDGCRIPILNGETPKGSGNRKGGGNTYGLKDWISENGGNITPDEGRFPTNIIHDGSDEIVNLFPDAKARFFYCAKASKSERGAFNNHPTVKPLSLIKYLCTLTMPPNKGIVLDPFLGSGTTAMACEQLNRKWIGVELDVKNCDIAIQRLSIPTV